MEVKVSSKYQVVIPKAVRRKLHITPGQKLTVEGSLDKQSIVIKKVNNVDQIIKTYAGSATGAWGTDPAKAIRRMRDEEWD